MRTRVCKQCGTIVRLRDSHRNLCKRCHNIRTNALIRRGFKARHIGNDMPLHLRPGRANKRHHSYREWQLLLASHGYDCYYCGEKQGITKDHIVPRSRGGSDLIENIQPLCVRCNQAKDDWTPFSENVAGSLGDGKELWGGLLRFNPLYSSIGDNPEVPTVVEPNVLEQALILLGLPVDLTTGYGRSVAKRDAKGFGLNWEITTQLRPKRFGTEKRNWGNLWGIGVWDAEKGGNLLFFKPIDRDDRYRSSSESSGKQNLE